MAKVKRNMSDTYSPKNLFSNEMPWSVLEAYKALRTNISFSLPGSGCKVIGITSACRGDGKSTSAINCAIAFGKIGKKVLLIDCDMRLPSDASKLNAKRTPGLSDVLSGQADVNKALQRLENHNITFLSAGNMIPDPTWLLQSEQMEKLIKVSKSYYDYVFIDLPPVTMVADASIMSTHMDGFLVVVRANVTQYQAIADMLTQLDMVGAKIIGAVYNGIVPENRKYYKKYYGREYKK